MSVQLIRKQDATTASSTLSTRPHSTRS